MIGIDESGSIVVSWIYLALAIAMSLWGMSRLIGWVPPWLRGRSTVPGPFDRLEGAVFAIFGFSSLAFGWFGLSLALEIASYAGAAFVALVMIYHVIKGREGFRKLGRMRERSETEGARLREYVQAEQKEPGRAGE